MKYNYVNCLRAMSRCVWHADGEDEDTLISKDKDVHTMVDAINDGSLCMALFRNHKGNVEGMKILKIRKSGNTGSAVVDVQPGCRTTFPVVFGRDHIATPVVLTRACDGKYVSAATAVGKGSCLVSVAGRDDEVGGRVVVTWAIYPIDVQAIGCDTDPFAKLMDSTGGFASATEYEYIGMFDALDISDAMLKE